MQLTYVVILTNDGKAVKNRKAIGHWKSETQRGKTRFSGKVFDTQEWSPWMRKFDLRDWFDRKTEHWPSERWSRSK